MTSAVHPKTTRTILLLTVLALSVSCSKVPVTSVYEPAEPTAPAEQQEPAKTPAQPATAPDQTQPTASYIVHKVQYAGETLSAIARWYTGSAGNWPIIAQANPTMDPNRIRIGDAIRIPEEIVTRQDPMPAPAMTTKQPAGGDPQPAPAATEKPLFSPVEKAPPKVEERLFGPVDSDSQPSPTPSRDKGLSRPLETLD